MSSEFQEEEKKHPVEKWTAFPKLISNGQAVIVLRFQLMIAILHAFIHEKAYTQQYGSASTTLALPDQSAHHDSVPMLAKGLAEPIIILLQLGKKIGGCLYSQIFQGWLQNARKHFSMAIMCAFSVIRKQEGYTENTCCRIGSFWLFFFRGICC